MKTKRQQKILDIINNNDINTQEELAAQLLNAGFKATQATISRDIKELQIVKVRTDQGYRYYCPNEDDDGTSLGSLVASAVKDVIPAGNIAAVKCLPGMAQAVCAALDDGEINDIVATIAGDDTIFALCHNAAKAKEVCKSIQKMIGR